MVEVLRRYAKSAAEVKYFPEEDVLHVIFDVKRRECVADREPCGAEVVWALDDSGVPIGITIWPAKHILYLRLERYLSSYLKNIGKLCGEYGYAPPRLAETEGASLVSAMVNRILERAAEPGLRDCTAMFVRSPWGESYYSWRVEVVEGVGLEFQYFCGEGGCSCKAALERGRAEYPCVAVFPSGRTYVLSEDLNVRLAALEDLSVLEVLLESSLEWPSEVDLAPACREVASAIKEGLPREVIVARLKYDLVRGMLPPHSFALLSELVSKLDAISAGAAVVLGDLRGLYSYVVNHFLRGRRREALRA